MEHVEMYFDDGTNPTLDMCRRFIDLADGVISQGGAVAVHCKAGLGRTGTLIGAYLIYKHGFTADEGASASRAELPFLVSPTPLTFYLLRTAIGFMRLMRPGSCVGPQQHFLYENQLEWVRWAAQDAVRAELAAQHGLAGTSLGAGATATAAAATATHERRPTTPPADSAEQPSGAAAAGSTTPGAGAHVPPVTPRRTGATVPGQPRKTPGRSRHAVAQPEEVSPQEKERLEAEREEERMEGVVLSSPRKRISDVAPGAGMGKGKAPATMGGGGEAEDDDDDDDDEDPIALVSPKKLQLAPAASIAGQAAAPATSSAPLSSRPKTPSAAPNAASSTSRPTRVPRPARPLSALADNRIVDRLGSNAHGTRMSTRAGQAHAPSSPGSGPGGLARSKAAKNLNTVFEADSAASGSSGGQSRYPLRNTRSGAQPPNSPTKLPQRVLGKRDAAPAPGARDASQSQSQSGSSTSSSRAGSVASSAGGFDPASVPPMAGKIGGRNVRRRRSSMGSQETVNAG